MIVYDEHPEYDRNAAFYTSTNLKDWTEQSHLPGYFECTELFELPVDGDADEYSLGGLCRGCEVRDRTFRWKDVYPGTRGQAPGPLGAVLRVSDLRQRSGRPQDSRSAGSESTRRDLTTSTSAFRIA